MIRNQVEGSHALRGTEDGLYATRQERSEDESETLEHAHERAVEIAGMKDYQTIVETLRAERLLDTEIERVAHEYGLDHIDFLNDAEKDYNATVVEMFTVIDLYDPVTARHCHETYEIARQRMEEDILPGVSFADVLSEREGVTLKQFYVAALLHDVGKVAVPRSVIQCKLPGFHKIRMRDVLSPEELEEVGRYGFTGDETFFDAVKVHEPEGGKTLASRGLHTEGALAASHHNYAGKPLIEFTLPISIGALHLEVSLSEVLHLADEEEALLSPDRPYKGPFSMARLMRYVVEDTEQGKVHPLSAYLWLTSALRRYQAQAPGPATTEDRADLVAVTTFLAREKRVVDTANA